MEALKIDSKIDCFTFHDVDLIPEDDRIMYTCPTQLRHVSSAIDKFDYILPYEDLVGGVLTIRTETYQKINGYSNLYWGWGGEGFLKNFIITFSFNQLCPLVCLVLVPNYSSSFE